MGPGRSCPTSYRYGAGALAATAPLELDCLWVAGGLYGNPFALQALLEAFGRERGASALVFNGDFHWFDAEPAGFAAIDDAVLSFHALRGNVETEIALPAPDAGCGCAYPQWVDDATVERSNRIIERLRGAARPEALPRLGALPMHLRAKVAGARIGIVHGDADSLAGWGFSQETLATAEGQDAAARAFAEAQVDVFASSHTCLPVLQAFPGARALANNGAAGMPNFRGASFGLATRIAHVPSAEALYRLQLGELFIEAMPLRYDAAAWVRRFLAIWPPGSDAHASYYGRIADGPQYTPGDALRYASL